MTSEIANNKRTKHRWLYKLMLLGLLTPLMGVTGLTAAESLAPNSIGVTAHAYYRDKKTGNIYQDKKEYEKLKDKQGKPKHDNKDGSGSESGSSSKASSQPETKSSSQN